MSFQRFSRKLVRHRVFAKNFPTSRIASAWRERKSLERHFPDPGKILGLTGLVYGLGLVSINLSYSFWGFHDFEILYQQGVCAGIWALAFIIMSFLPSAFMTFLLKGMRQKAKWQLVALLIIFALMTGGLIYWHRNDIRGFLQGHYRGFLYAIMMSMAAGAGTALSAFIPDIKEAIFSKLSKSETENLLLSLPFSVLPGFMLLLLFAGFYVTIPAGWGGGKPAQRDLWVSKEGLSVLGACSVNSVKAQRGDLSLISKSWVLHESKESIIVWRDGCPTISFPKDWARSTEWPQKQD